MSIETTEYVDERAAQPQRYFQVQVSDRTGCVRGFVREPISKPGFLMGNAFREKVVQRAVDKAHANPHWRGD